MEMGREMGRLGLEMGRLRHNTMYDHGLSFSCIFGAL